MADLKLNPIVVDYDGIYAQFLADLQTLPSGSWNNLAHSSTGSTLIRWMASLGAFFQGGIARALQENFDSTARSASAQYRAQILKGIQLIRTRPGTIPVSLTRTDASASTLVIPAYSQFLVGGVPFYNNAPILMSVTGAAAEVTLRQGSVTTEQFLSDGSSFQLYTLGTSGLWNVGDSDIWMVDSASNVWTSITTGLWRQPGTSTTFFQRTLPDGVVECRFGNGQYGGVPAAGILTFGYATCLNAADALASQQLPGAAVSVSGYTVIGTATGAATPTQDPPGPEFYKAMGPGGATAGAGEDQRAVTRDDHRAVALDYPGVVDALFRGQAETNPADLRFSNVLYVTLLTTSVWTEQQWLDFKQYMESQRSLATCVLVRSDPTPVTIDLTITVTAFPPADLGAVEAIGQDAVNKLLTPQAGSLGASLYYSDVSTAIEEAATYQVAPNESGELVDYIAVPALSRPVELSPTSYFVPGNIVVSATYTKRGLSAAETGQILGL